MKVRNGNTGKLNKKYLWSFFAVVLIVDLIITILLFTLYSSIQTNKAKEHYSSQLDQVCLMTDLLYEYMDSFAKQIIQDKDTYGCLRNSSFDRLQESKACRKLRDIQTSNPYIRYVSFYNSESQRLLSSSYAGYLSSRESELLYNQVSANQNTCYVRKIGANYYTQQDKRVTVYTFIFKIKIRPGSTSDLIIIDVNEQYFQSVFNSLRSSWDYDQSVILVSPENKIISTQLSESGSKNFLQKLYDTSFDPKILENRNHDNGSFTYTYKNQPLSLITYATAAKSGIRVVNVVPYYSVLSGLVQIGVLTLSLAILTLGFGYMISRKMSRILYAPIQTLYSNYVQKADKESSETELEQLNSAFSEMYSKANRLEQGLISTYNDSKRLYLDYLLNGRLEAERNIDVLCEKLGIDISSPYYTVIIINCVENNTTTKSSQDLFINYYALNNMIKEVLSFYGHTEILRTKESSFAVLLSLENKVLPEQICENLETVNQVMIKEFGIETTMCVGKVIEDYRNINMCYEATKIAMNSSSYKLHGRAFIAGTTAETFTVDQYYNKLHTKFSEYIRNENLEECSKEFDRAISSMDNISFNTAKIYFNHVMMSLLDEFSNTLEKSNDSFTDLLGKMESIFSAQNVREMKQITMSFLSSFVHLLALNKKGSNQDAIEQAKTYIEENFSNPDLSLRVLSDIAGLSPAYFGKMFTAVTTFSFNDYLNHIRMKEAAQMLENTKLTVTEISEKVGILNTNYFYSVFKKRYGTTPSNYRKNLKS